MRTTLIASVFNGVLLASLSSAAYSQPTKPGLTFLYTVNITGGTPVQAGPGPFGDRLVIPILEGTFAGPKMKGTSRFFMPSYLTRMVLANLSP